MTSTNPYHGPYRTSREATTAGIAARRAGESLSDAHLRILTDAITGAGVDLGPYDQRIVRWLANSDSPTVAVIAGLITRAAEQPADSRAPVGTGRGFDFADAVSKELPAGWIVTEVAAEIPLAGAPGTPCPGGYEGCTHDLTQHSARIGCWLCDCTYGLAQ
jgi:hypothetical protein